MTEEVYGKLKKIGRALGHRPEEGFYDIDAPLYKPQEAMSYDDVFRGLLEKAGTSFIDYLNSRKQYGQNTNILDLFGSGWFVGDPSLADSITGFRLKDNTPQMEKNIEKAIIKAIDAQNISFLLKLLYAQQVVKSFKIAKNCNVIEGNAYAISGWQRIYAHMRAKDISTFDLITAKPEGAFSPREIVNRGPNLWENIDSYRAFFLQLLNRAYAKLSFDGGILVTQVPEFAFQKLTEEVVPIMIKRGNMDVFTSEKKGGIGGLLIREYPSSTNNIKHLFIQ